MSFACRNSTVKSTIRNLDDVVVITSAARCERTPCGDDEMVWHVWGEGPPVVLLHGGSGSWTHWVRNLEALLRSGYRVLAPDMPGFGDSAVPPDGHNADVLPPWIEKGLDTLLGPQPFDLVGFSFGGLVVGLFAARYAERVQRLVLVGAPGARKATVAHALAQAPDLRSLVFIPQAGHWVQYEQSDAFDAKLALALAY